MIYFIGTKKVVKIGYSANPLERLQALQTGYPFELKLMALIPGSYQTECELHKLFDRLRLEGEWFRNCGQLKACIMSFYDHGRKHKEVKTVRQLLENGMHLQCRQKLKRNTNFRNKVQKFVVV